MVVLAQSFPCLDIEETMSDPPGQPILPAQAEDLLSVLPPDERFFWVSQQGETSTRSGIQRHVQVVHHENRKRRGLLPYRTGIPPLESMQRRPTSSSESESRGREMARRIAPSPVSSPVNMLGRGNSDPFNALAISVGPEVHELINFHRQHLFRSSYQLELTVKVAPMLATYYSEETTTMLSNESTFYGILARAASAISSGSLDSPYAAKALRYNIACTQLLRNNLTSEGISTVSLSLLKRQILLLLQAETFSHNYESAKVYAKLLQQFLKASEGSPGSESESEIMFLNYSMYIDQQLSAMYLTRSSFDIDYWFQKYFQPLCLEAEVTVPFSAFPGNGSEKTLGDGPLQGTIIGLRWVYRGIQHFMQQPSATTPNTWLAISAKGHWCCQKLIDIYLNAEDASASLDAANLATAHLKNWLNAQMYTALASLLLARQGARIDTIQVTDSITLYDAGPRILATLMACLSWRGPTAHPETTSTFPRLRMWALYVGAQSGLCNENQRRFFDDEFVAHLKRMEIWLWEDLEEILTGFLYLDQYFLCGTDWFYEILVRNA